MLKQNMNKKGLAIVNAYDTLPSTQHFIDRMAYELKTYGIELEMKTAAEIYAYVGNEGELYTADLPYDFVLFLDKDKYIARMIEEGGLPMFNSSTAIELCDDKMKTYLSLLHAGIKMPATVSAPLRYTVKNNEKFITNMLQVLNFPLVAKSNYGSMGDGVFLVKDYEELKQVEKKLTYLPHLYQEFISTSAGFDYRLIVIGGKVVAAMKRQSTTGDFRSNIALGGVGEMIDPNYAFEEMAEKAAKILGLDYCGVDILKGENGEPVLCEVNSNAFLKEIEAVTRKNIAGIYAKHIFEKVYHF